MFTLIIPTSNAHALSGKVASTVAKKVAKDLAEDIAVQQAMDIIWNYQLKDLMPDNDPDRAFACIGKKVTSPEQCPDGKKVYMKKELTNTDKKALENTVETVLEEKTLTSSKWGKFLDFFIPLFLVTGVVEFFNAELDPDSQSFLDEVALESLQRSGLITPYQDISTGPLYDFNDYIENVTVDFDSYWEIVAQWWIVTINFDVKKDFEISYLSSSGGLQTHNYTAGDSSSLIFAGSGWGQGNPDDWRIRHAAVYLREVNGHSLKDSQRIYFSEQTYDDDDDAEAAAINWINGVFRMSIMSMSNDPNRLINYLFELTQNDISASVPEQSETELEITIEDLLLSDLIKNELGNFKLLGIDSFVFKTQQGTEVFPDTTSNTGWRSKEDGQPIHVNENELDIKTKEELDPEEPQPDPDPTTKPNLPWQLVIALLELLKAILLFMVRLFNFVFDLPFVPEKPINNSVFEWFKTAEWLGIRVYSVISSIATFLLAMTIYRVVRRVF